MKKSVIFSSATGQTEKLANVIRETLGEVSYFGKPSDEAKEADVLYVGSWTIGGSCTKDIKEFLESLSGKKVFCFMTAGYGDSKEFLTPILDSMKANLNDTNEVLGGFICQGEVSPQKLEAMKENAEKFASMKPELDKSIGTPTQSSLDELKNLVK